MFKESYSIVISSINFPSPNAQSFPLAAQSFLEVSICFMFLCGFRGLCSYIFCSHIFPFLPLPMAFLITACGNSNFTVIVSRKGSLLLHQMCHLPVGLATYTSLFLSLNIFDSLSLGCQPLRGRCMFFLLHLPGC